MKGKGANSVKELPYNNSKAVAYARHWALGRNPAYYDFQAIGGDCTNFASQCLFAGAESMNYTPVTGWYYRSSSDRTASWTNAEYLYEFLVNNRSVGPFAHAVPWNGVQPGDIVQLGNENGSFYHTPVITAVTPVLLVAAHTYDALDVPLSSYTYYTARFLHIDGVRKW